MGVAYAVDRPSCKTCNVETTFRQTMPNVRDMAQVQIYECSKCKGLSFYRIENGAFKSWP
jgi:hypothetical protein